VARERIFMGLWSGWAADGVDAAIAGVSRRGRRVALRQIHYVHAPFDEPLRRDILSVAGGAECSAGRLAELDRRIAEAFAKTAEIAVSELGLSPDAIVAVGSSGQPIARGVGRDGGHVALELASPARIAAQLGRPCAAGFAASDLAAGGVGGPIVAWPDWNVFHHARLSRVVVHLGGVTSLTFVPAGSVAGDVVAFDVGPGTLVLDAIARSEFGRECDSDGAIAARGTVRPELLGELCSNAFFAMRPPKAAGGDMWPHAGARLDLAAENRRYEPADLLATYTEFIARGVADAVARLTERPHEVVLAGGGARNIHLAQRIRLRLSPCSTYAIERYGYGLTAWNAVAVASLAAARIDEVPAHCHVATGAGEARVLGGLWLPNV